MKDYRQARPFHRLIRWSAGTRPMSKFFGVIQHPLDRFVYRLTGGRTTASAWLAGVQITMLTTTGAKTGRLRTVPLLGLAEGEKTILIASNFGRPHHPGWYHNLRANPRATISVNGVRRDVVARELFGAEREDGYRLGEVVFPGFKHYRRWTGSREIPVLSLETPAANNDPA